jgi:hypothetical protein
MPPETAATPANPPPRNGRARGVPVFLLALLVGVGLHLAVLTTLHITLAPALAQDAPAAAFVSYLPPPTAAEIAAQGEPIPLFDPELLYFPNPHNFSAQNRPEPLAQPPATFAAFPPDVTLPKENFHLLAASPGPAATPDETLQPRQWDILSSLGQAATTAQPFAAVGAHLQVLRLDSGATAQPTPQQFTWPVENAPQAGKVRWGPAKFLLTFNASGLVDESLLSSSVGSRVEGLVDVDDDLRNELRDWFSHHPLPAGAYQVIIAP